MKLIEDILARTPNGPIYHYTSLSGLKGIIESKSIWATNMHYLNDSHEYAHALQMIRNEIKMRSVSCSDHLERRLLGELDQALTEIEKITIFVCSFSENGDLLSQWRGYCPRGNGFSIGFNYDKLRPLLKLQNFSIAPCIYEPAQQSQVIKELIDSLLADHKLTPTENAKVINRLREQFCIVAPMIKDKAFSEEREWRAISNLELDFSKTAFREGVSMLTPYFVLQLEPENEGLPIFEISVGPTPHMDLSKESVAMLISYTANNYSKIGVVPSSIPYRGW